MKCWPRPWRAKLCHSIAVGITLVSKSAESRSAHAGSKKAPRSSDHVDGPITYQILADDLVAFIEHVAAGPAYNRQFG